MFVDGDFYLQLLKTLLYLLGHACEFYCTLHFVALPIRKIKFTRMYLFFLFYFKTSCPLSTT